MDALTVNLSHTDDNLQTINEDVAQIILKYLQNYGPSLVAFSLTCTRWHTKISSFIDRRLLYLAPNLQTQFTAQRNKVYDELTSMCDLCEIRVFEQLDTFVSENDIVGIYPVPWDSTLVVLAHETVFLVLNISDGSVVYRQPASYRDLIFRIGDPICFNEHLRLIGAQMIDEITKEDFINVYSLNGKVVQMIDKICCHATRVIITDDGTVWIRPDLKCYSLKTKSYMDIAFSEENSICAIRSNATKDGALLYYVTEENESIIRCLNTATRTSWVYLNHFRLEADDVGNPRITFLPDCEIVKVGDWDSCLIHVVDGKFKFVMTASKLHDIELSPDKTKFFYAEHTHLSIYSINTNAEEYIKTMPEENFSDYEGLCNDEQLCRLLTGVKILDGRERKRSKSSSVFDFHWVNDNTIFGLGADCYVIIDVNTTQTEVRATVLPMALQMRRGIHNFQVVDDHNVVVHAATEKSSVIIKFALQ